MVRKSGREVIPGSQRPGWRGIQTKYFFCKEVKQASKQASKQADGVSRSTPKKENSSLDKVRERQKIDHFTVVCLVTWLLNGSKTGVNLVLIQT